MVIMEPTRRGLASTEDIWTPYKALYNTISKFLSAPDEFPLVVLEETLKSNKQTFLNLLKNSGADAKSRQEIVRCLKENASLPGRQTLHVTRQLIDETIILSDMFGINEYVALDLLCVAEQQLQHYPDLTRGLVAVMLYYDGRKAICDSLCLLAQARRGVSWEFSSPSNSRLIAAYLDQLVANNLISNILELLGQLSVSKEMEKLQKNRGLGGPKHQRLIYDVITGTRQTLADTVFCLSAQAGLPQSAIVPLVKYISDVKLEPRAVIDEVTLALVMALLYALDVSILQRKEEQDELVQRLPLVSEHSLIPYLMRELSAMSTTSWGCKGLQGVTQLAWGLTLCSLRMAPASIRNRLTLRDEDELLISASLDDNAVFEFLSHCILPSSAFAKEEFYVRRMHTLFTDLLILMPMKVKEMRNYADDAAKVMNAYMQEGLQPPKTLPHHFENLMLSIATLYQNDKQGLGLEFLGIQPIEGNLMFARTPVAQNILSKFANLTKESLPSMLFLPYLKFLASLAKEPKGAQYVFQLLNASNDIKCTISWAHFYRALKNYTVNLSQDAQVAVTDSVYRPRGMPKGINPQELLGLHSVLALIRVVADNDPIGRLNLAQNSSWNPITTFFKLIRCAVPVPLKADILLTLASLAKSPEVANEIWQTMEATNIICTTPASGNYQPKGLQTELEEVETRNEEYPLSIAAVTLLNSLAQNAELPLLLGVQRRSPGLTPHMYFVLDCVFLPFLKRNYQKPGEKWQLAEKCLEFLHTLLAQYEPSIQDVAGRKVEVVPGQTLTNVAPHPGFTVLVALNSPSPLLTLVLEILDEACMQLDKFTDVDGKECLENSVLHILSLLNLALAKLPKLNKVVTAASSGQVATTLIGLDKLLFTINPRTGHMDHPINVIKFLTYAQWLPKHASLTVRLLTLLASNPSGHAQLLMVLSTAPQSKVSRYAFVELLDHACQGETSNNQAQDKSDVLMQLKQEVVDFLLQCLIFPAPTVAHVLLGFETSGHGIRHTVLQHPGVLGFPRNCLHSIVQILDNLLAMPKVYQNPSYLHERCFAILYTLIINPESARPTLKYLRLCTDFLARHVTKVRAAIVSKSPNSLSCAAWLLRCIAIDLKLSSSDKQKSSIQGLMRALLSMPAEDLRKPVDTTHLSYGSYQEKQRHGSELVAMILQDAQFTIQEVDEMQWRYFESSQIELAIKKCEFPAGSPSEGLVDISKLNYLFKVDLVKSNSYISQRDLVNAELKDILNFAAKVNQARGVCLGSTKLVGAWRQVVGVLFNVIPMEFMAVGQRHRLLLAIIKQLLSKIQASGASLSPEIASLSSSALLLLLASLRQCHLVVLETRERALDISQPLLDTSGSIIADPYLLAIDTPTVGAVLSGIAHWLNQPFCNVQLLRSNLYGSVLLFLHLACFDATSDELRELGQGLGGSSLFFRRLAQNPVATNVNAITTLNQRRMAALEELSKLNENWINSIFVDATRGHEVCSMLALSMIAALFRLSPQANWTTLMINKGYLQSIIESILKSDPELLKILRPVPTNLKPLYVYEAKMALLCQLVQERPEAEACMRLRLLSVLSELTALDCRPFGEDDVNTGFSDVGIPGTLARYHQILMPALQVCATVLHTMGDDNISTVNEVTHFLLKHSDVLQLILRSCSPNMNVDALRELNLVVELLMVCANTAPLDNGFQNQNNYVYLERLRQFVLSLMPKFFINQQLAYSLRVDDPDKEEEDKRYLLVVQIATRLATFARRSAINIKHPAVIRPIFKPAVSDSVSQTGSMHMYTMDLGMLLDHINDVSSLIGKSKKLIELEILRLNNISTSQGNMSIVESYVKTRQQVEERVVRRKAEFTALCLLCEESLHLLWVHLDLYLRRNLPRLGHPLNESLLEPCFQATANELSHLKQQVAVGISDRVEAQILEAVKENPERSREFVKMLLRKIKRLVQFHPV